MEISCRNAFCTKIKRQPLYWQGISNEQRNKTDQAHVFKKSSLTEDHFPVYVIQHRKFAWILETKHVFQKPMKTMLRLLLSWIYYHFSTVLDVVPPVFKKMQTLCIQYERHTCLMYMRSVAVLSVQNNLDSLEILSKNKYFVFYWLLFPLLQTFYNNE